jgi:pimeloyl-ACP methyl ester carboxylesterase
VPADDRRHFIGNEEKIMERRKFLGALTGTSLGVLLNGSLGEFAQAQSTTQAASSHSSGTSQFPPNSTIVLVHAAWADGSCWRNVILPLERHGLHVICAPLPLTSLTNDTIALSQVLERTSGPVVLVGHAYSGAVIAAVQQDRVKSLVYITALAPDEGETVAKVFYLNPNSPEAPKMAPDSHGFVWLPDDAFPRAITHKASAGESKIAAALQRPLGVKCIQELAPTPAWKTKPSWFLVAEEDRMISPKTQRFMANRMHAKIHSAPADHSPMISDPQAVINVILEAAHETLSL